MESVIITLIIVCGIVTVIKSILAYAVASKRIDADVEKKKTC